MEKLGNEKKKFAAAKKFKDAGKCQQEIKDLLTKESTIDEQIKKTQELKSQTENDLQNETEQLKEIEAKLSKIKIDSEKNQQFLITYRREEIMDLISSLQKVLDTTSEDNMATKRRSTILSDQGKNEMNMKVEKLQEELTNLDS